MEEREEVLDYLASGKGIIPYQTITDLDSFQQNQATETFSKKKASTRPLEKKIFHKRNTNMLTFFLGY